MIQENIFLRNIIVLEDKGLIGFDIGGTKCAVCKGIEKDGILHILDKEIIKTDFSISPYEMIDKMFEMAKSMTDDIDVIGISCGGPLNTQLGVILSPPNLMGWDNIKIVEYLNDKYNVKSYLENDANACTLAEWKFGAGKGCNNMIFMTFGTGLGAGMILNGKLYRGANDMAGELGHIRLGEFGPVGYGKMGSFEGFCSGNGIAQLGRSFALERFQAGKTVSFCESAEKLLSITAKTIAESAKMGNEDAIFVYNKCGEMLGRGLSIVIDILNPEKIVIGSVFQRCEELLRESMQKVLEKECLGYSLKACKIVPAYLEENIGDYAALSVAAMNKEVNCGE